MDLVRKPPLLLLLAIGLFLSACSPAALTPASPVAATPTQAPTEAAVARCTVESSIRPTAGPTELALYPPPSPADWTLGPDTAGVTVLEYADFQCLLCSQIAPILSQLQADSPQDLRLVYRHYPLAQHDKALLSAQAAEAAGLQGKFWEMHDAIYAEQQTWTAQTPAEFETWLAGQSAALGLDKTRFTTDLHSDDTVQKVKTAQAEAQRAGLVGTPSLVINGRPYSGPPDAQSLSAIVRLILLEKHQFTSCPAMSIDPRKDYLATVKTERGDVVIQLYADQAPMAVNSFIFLARSGWYDGVMFHRVLPDFIAQAGDPTGTGYGGPGYAFENEISPSLKFDRAGVVAMANAGPDSNGSQFFISYQSAPKLDGIYTIFGQVIQGMDVVQKLTPRNPDDSANLPPGDKILSIRIEEK
jgi:cyclophilin family peptidyl-prolyl cis-trans isomerase/protein-disulfide isomerase